MPRRRALCKRRSGAVDPPRSATRAMALSLCVFWVVSWSLLSLPFLSSIQRPSFPPSLPLSLLYTSLARSAQCGPPISPAAMSPPMIIEGKQHRCGNDFEPELLHAPIPLLRPKKLVARCRRCITTWIGSGAALMARRAGSISRLCYLTDLSKCSSGIPIPNGYEQNLSRII